MPNSPQMGSGLGGQQTGLCPTSLRGREENFQEAMAENPLPRGQREPTSQAGSGVRGCCPLPAPRPDTPSPLPPQFLPAPATRQLPVPLSLCPHPGR